MFTHKYVGHIACFIKAGFAWHFIIDQGTVYLQVFKYNVPDAAFVIVAGYNRHICLLAVIIDIPEQYVLDPQPGRGVIFPVVHHP